MIETKMLEKKNIPPIPKYPAITIVGRGITRDRTYAGVDVPAHDLELSVFTKLLDKEWSLDQNLDIVEVLKDAVQYNNQWGGRCQDTMINSIQYDRADVSGIGLVYRSRVLSIIEGHEYISA